MEIKAKELVKGVLVICLYFVLQIILATPFIFLLENKKISENVLYLIVYLGLAIIFSIIYRKTLIENIKDFKKNNKTILKSTLKYWFLGLLLMLVSSVVINQFNINTTNNQDANINLFIQAPILQAICAIILAPIIEELVFRRSFKDFTTNPIIFSLTTGLIFGLVHITSSLTSPQDLIMFVHLIPYSSVGIALGYAYKKNNNNIIGTMLIHALHNTIAIIEILILL